MLHYAIVFFVIAIIAAVLGFSGIAGAASNVAWILFVVFLILAVVSLLPLRGEPPMTRFLAEQLSTTHWYDMAPAARDFGYRPRVSFHEGLTQLKHSWSNADTITG